ncbi:MAG: hypothetical protein SFV23_03795 [Planctomycetaceae bacterium]|nr:hypothetical protein [Planctomycetaceae bacterium]
MPLGPSTRTRRRLPIGALLLLAAAGCGGGNGDDPELHRVRGRVTLDTEGLDQARVIYTPVGGGRSVIGLTNSGGYYDLAFSTNSQGAPAGKYIVSIHTGRDAEPDPQTGDERPPIPETLPAEYNRQSVLKATVPGSPGAYDFDLTSKPGVSTSTEAQ